MGHDIRRLSGEDDLGDAFDIRRAVFMAEQGVTADQEFDGHDDDAIHYVVYHTAEPVGTARLRFPDDSTAKIERVAVRKRNRGQGFGRILVRTLEDEATEQGCSDVVLHAQTRVEGFYEKLGYETVSDVFIEDGIEHVTMTKSLQ